MFEFASFFGISGCCPLFGSTDEELDIMDGNMIEKVLECVRVPKRFEGCERGPRGLEMLGMLKILREAERER